MIEIVLQIFLAIIYWIILILIMIFFAYLWITTKEYIETKLEKRRTKKKEAIKQKEIEIYNAKQLQNKHINTTSSTKSTEFITSVDFVETTKQILNEEGQDQILETLLIKKGNWQEFQTVLKKNNITTLYHFTDLSNIDSIKKYGGLYSWDYCHKHDIRIPLPGGDQMSRNLDTHYGLEDYVRLSFTRTHPMLFATKKQGRIKNPVLLEISLDVCYLRSTKFANMNATKTGHIQGENLEALQAIHFDTITEANYFNLDDFEKPYFQAEILIKTYIPINYITNINNF